MRCTIKLSPLTTDSRNPSRPSLTLAIASLAVLATFMDATVLFVAFPDITPASLSDAVVNFRQIWWLIVAGGIATSLLALPLRSMADVTKKVSTSELAADALIH